MGVPPGRFFMALVVATACSTQGEAPGTPSAEPARAPTSSPAPTGGEPGQAASGRALAATVIAATIYKLPDTGARRLGYLRLGRSVARDEAPVEGNGCKGQWFGVKPTGYVCTDEATTDLSLPIVRAAKVGPDLSKAMPYRYGFVRATAPQYLRVPSHSEQEKSEFQLAEHLDWYEQNRLEVQRVELGANDVPLDPRGFPLIGGSLPEGQKLTSQLVKNEVFGGERDAGPPWWLEGGRKIPNVSGFDVPDYAVFAGRVRRKTGLSVVDAFLARDGEFERRFAVTVDMRLIPVSKLKPDAASLFHGVELRESVPLPLGFVNQRGVTTWKLIKNRDEAKPAEAIPFRAVVPLSGKARIKAGARYYQTAGNAARWLKASEVGVVRPPPSFPEAAQQGKKWIDVSLAEQTLTLYEGQRAVYATLVSTGRDRMGDPKTTLSTPQGEFRIRSKHVAAAMDSEENSTVLGGTRDVSSAPALGPEVAKTIARLKQAEKEGKKLDEGDRRRLANIKKGRHPEYGITQRRGSQNYELRDVPWIQYFAAGYALHGAYWHDVFGIPRSHGCINLSPIDARAVFRFTEPNVPEGWHGVNAGDETGEGTTIVVRE